MNDNYWLGVKIVGGVTFAIGWIYAAASYGLFIGIGLGWIPAAVIGLIAGLLWPIVVLAFAAVALLVLVAVTRN